MIRLNKYHQWLGSNWGTKYLTVVTVFYPSIILAILHIVNMYIYTCKYLLLCPENKETTID